MQTESQKKINAKKKPEHVIDFGEIEQIKQKPPTPPPPPPSNPTMANVLIITVWTQREHTQIA